MVKVKTIRSADCVVGGFRYLEGTKVVGSLLLGLYGDDGLLHHVGFTSTITDAELARRQHEPVVLFAIGQEKSLPGEDHRARLVQARPVWALPRARAGVVNFDDGH